MTDLMKTDPVLPALVRAKEALAVAYANRDIGTAKEILDKAQTVQVYIQRRDHSLELAQQASEIKVPVGPSPWIS